MIKTMKLEILLFILTFVSQRTGVGGQQSLYSPNCEQFDYCSNHGSCMNGGTACMCNFQYDGTNCSICAVGYFKYPVCYPCKFYCRNGGICKNDTCICPTNATDISCSNCTPNFNGQYCTQNPIGFAIITNGIVYDIGGASITIIGAHFNTNASTAATVRCRFESYRSWYNWYYSSGSVYYSSSGVVMNGSALVCITPAMRSDSYNVSFSLDNGISWFSDGYNNQLSRLTLTVTTYCPSRLNKCSFNGNCEYGLCVCNEEFAGEKCDQCAEGLFEYPLCVSCYNFCKNSEACINGTCICTAPYSGSRCTECPVEYNGRGCLRIPMILSVAPEVVFDLGGTNLTVTISNFDKDITNVLCKLQSDYNDGNFIDISYGHIVNRTTLYCLTPRMNSSTRRLSISTSGGITWINSSIRIYVSGTCPNRCYQGYCSFGQCICDMNITGPSCSSCALGYYHFPNCYQCLDCESNNGICDLTNDNCICGDPVRFTGTLCNECQPNYYGPNCTNTSYLLSIQPNSVSDQSIRDGINVTLTGSKLYFISLSDVICRFQVMNSTWSVPAISGNTSTVICSLSYTVQQASIIVSLSLDNKMTWVEKSNTQWGFSISVYPTCPLNSDCNYGTCSYGNCICNFGYTGTFCDRCDNGFFGFPYCYMCSLYCANNGTCMNGTCVCAERFTGILCTQCQPLYYGSQCLKIPVLLSVSPTTVLDVGGVNLTVIGDYFDEYSTTVLCRFRLNKDPFTAQINYGNVINRTALNCLAPQMESSQYQLYASTDNGTTWINSSVYLSVEITCPTGSNNCNLGRCSFGGCICNTIATGSTCSSCALGYYNFPNCYSCYYCEQNNGTCDHTNDTCICRDSVRFTGIFCNLCQPNYQGPNCTNNSQLVGLSSTSSFPMTSQSMFNSSFMTTFMEMTKVTSSPSKSITSYYDSSRQSVSISSEMPMTLLTTMIPTVTTNFYIQFKLSLSISNENLTSYEISFQLVAIFTSALGIHSNQINITVIITSSRTQTNTAAQLRLFSSALESADSLLTRIREQLINPSSSLRNHDLTSQLTEQSISDVIRIYICNDKKEQETPCLPSTTTKSTLTSSQTSILLATIIPSIIGALLIAVIFVFLIRYLRQQSKRSSSSDRSRHDFSRF